MPPKAALRRMRRPAARGGALKRPSVKDVESHTDVQKFSQVNPLELLSLGPICLQNGIYYGRTVHLAGELINLKNRESQIFGEFKVSGTKDEELLRLVSGRPSRLVTLHLCGADCQQQLTDETLIHAADFEKVDLKKSPWLTNLVQVGSEEGEDEMGKLRQEQERLAKAAEESKKDDRKEKKKKEDRKKRKEGREASPKKEDENLELGQKDLKSVFGETGMDPDVKKRTKMMKKARRLGQSKKKKKRKRGSSSEEKASSSTTTSSTSSEHGAEGLFDEERRLKKIWRQCPGALTAQALGEVKDSLMTDAGTMWSVDKASLPPLFVHYARTQLKR